MKICTFSNIIKTINANIRLQESRQSDISEAYNQLIFAIDNFKNYADKIMSL